MKRSIVVLLLFIEAVVLAACSVVQSGSSTSPPIFTFLHHFAAPDYVEPADSYSGSTTSKGLTTCSCDPSGVA